MTNGENDGRDEVANSYIDDRKGHMAVSATPQKKRRLGEHLNRFGRRGKGWIVCSGKACVSYPKPQGAKNNPVTVIDNSVPIQIG